MPRYRTAYAFLDWWARGSPNRRGLSVFLVTRPTTFLFPLLSLGIFGHVTREVTFEKICSNSDRIGATDLTLSQNILDGIESEIKKAKRMGQASAVYPGTCLGRCQAIRNQRLSIRWPLSECWRLRHPVFHTEYLKGFLAGCDAWPNGWPALASCRA